jgi:alkylation response protein AidB-like acyl-CoA dehydrogenase
MEFLYTEEEETLRREVQEFIADNMDAELRAEVSKHEYQLRRGPKTREFYKRLAERKWLAIAWPVEWGGQGGSRIHQYIVEEELVRAGLPVTRGGGGVPAIAARGTEEQKDTFIRAAVNDDIYFALGFTEPDAGADLAGLKTRAVRDGDEYVINGQKLYTSGAHFATHIYMMVRTDPEAERHSGLSILLVPVDTPGITITPLWTVQNDPEAPPGTTYGTSRTNTVYLDNVRVPVSALLGKENEGWSIGQSGLNLDRVGAGRYLTSVHLTEDVVSLVRNDDEIGARLREDPVARDALAELWIEGQVCRLFTMRSMSIAERDGKFTYEGSAEKVWAPEHGVRATERVSQLLGPHAQLLNGSPDAIEDGMFAHNLLGAYQSGINHGSVQIMRDQVARRGLGMPRSR